MKFTESFPEVKSIKLLIKENGRDASNQISHGQAVIDMEHIDALIHHDRNYKCSNSLCNHNNGYNIYSILFSAVKNKEVNIDVQIRCHGANTSSKGRVIYKRCLNFIIINACIEYN